MDLQLLETFLDLAETKNFTQTAKRLKKSQAAISLQINRLEEMLGKFLFDRDNRNVNLSQDGEILVAYAKQILNMHQELLYRFSALPIEGSVSMGSIEDFSSQILPEILSSFSKQYPKIILSSMSANEKKLKDLFSNELIDVIIYEDYTGAKNSDLIPLKEENLVWVRGKDFHHDWNKPLPLILGDEDCSLRKKIVSLLEQDGISYRIVYSNSSSFGRSAAIKSGLGFGLIPLSSLKKDVEQIDHSSLPKAPKAQLVMQKSKKITLAQEALADHIMMQFQG